MSLFLRRRCQKFDLSWSIFLESLKMLVIFYSCFFCSIFYLHRWETLFLANWIIILFWQCTDYFLLFQWIFRSFLLLSLSAKDPNIAYRLILIRFKLFLADWHYALCRPDDHTSKCRQCCDGCSCFLQNLRGSKSSPISFPWSPMCCGGHRCCESFTCPIFMSYPGTIHFLIQTNKGESYCSKFNFQLLIMYFSVHSIRLRRMLGNICLRAGLP